MIDGPLQQQRVIATARPHRDHRGHRRWSNTSATIPRERKIDGRLRSRHRCHAQQRRRRSCPCPGSHATLPPVASCVWASCAEPSAEWSWPRECAPRARARWPLSLCPTQSFSSCAPSNPRNAAASISDQLTTTADGQTELKGNVDVHVGEREIQADQLIYDRNNNSLNVSGQVRFHDPTVLVQGDTGRYSDDGALFNHAQFQLLQQSGHGSASQIAMSPSEVITFRNVTYTSCPQQRATWQIRARELRLDTAGGVGVGRGAIIDVHDIPIAYLPWISFPLNDARKSGFLFPEISTSSRSGGMLATPWYWNIAPTQDATLVPTYYSYRGLDMGVQYRFLSSWNRGSIDASYLPSDRAYGAELRAEGRSDPNSDRSYLRLLDRLQLPGNTRIDTSVESVSDSEYFEDFSQGCQASNTPFLARSVAIGHRNDIWNLRGEVLDFQTLDNTLPDEDRPYIQLPRLTAAGSWSPQRWPLLLTGIDAELVNFTRSIGGACSCADASCKIGR